MNKRILALCLLLHLTATVPMLAQTAAAPAQTAAAPAQTAAAPDIATGPRVTLSFHRQPLSDALRRLFQQAHVAARLPAGPINGTITRDLNSVPLETALRLTLREAAPVPYTFRREGDLYVIFVGELTAPGQETFRPVERPPTLVAQSGHTAAIHSVYFSRDGRMVASADAGNATIIWNVADKKIVLRIPQSASPAAFSPDGKLFVTDSTYGSFQVLDLASGISRFEAKGNPAQAAFSADGKTILSCDWNTLHFRNLVTGGASRPDIVLEGHTALRAGYSPDGLRILVSPEFAAADGPRPEHLLRMLDARTGRVLWKEGQAALHAWAGRLSPDGKHLAARADPLSAPGSQQAFGSANPASSGNAAAKKPAEEDVVLLDAVTGSVEHRLSFRNYVQDFTFSGDSRTLVTRSGYNGFQAWSVAAGTEVKIAGNTNALALGWNELAFVPGGASLAGSSRPGTLTLTNIVDGRAETYDTRGSAPLSCFAIDNSMGVLAVGDEAGKLYLMKKDHSEAARPFGGRNRQVGGVAFAAGNRLVSVSGERIVIWDLTLQTPPQFLDARPPYLLSGTGERLVTTDRDNSICLWDVRTGRRLQKGEAQRARITALALNHSNVNLASGAQDGSIQLWILKPNGRPKEQIGETVFGNSHSYALDKPIVTLAFGGGERVRDVNLIAVTDTDELRILDTRHAGSPPLAALTATKEKGAPRRYPAFAISPAGNRVAYVEKGELRALEVETGRPLAALKDPYFASDEKVRREETPLLFTRDGSQVITERAGALTFWNLQTQEGKLSEYRGYRPALSPGDSYLMTLIDTVDAADAGAKPAEGRRGWHSWAVSTPTVSLFSPGAATPAATLRGHEGSVSCVTFRRDDRWVATGGYDSTVRLWYAPTGEEVARFIVAGEDDYLIASPDNYYTASKGALQDISFRYGNTVCPFEQFDLRNNRPDLVLQRLLSKGPHTAQDVTRMEQARGKCRLAFRDRLRKQGLTESQLTISSIAPAVALTGGKAAQDVYTFTVSVKDASRDATLTRLLCYVNNVPANASVTSADKKEGEDIAGRNGLDLRARACREFTASVRLKLSKGSNKIQVTALNSRGVESLKQTLEVPCAGSGAKPRLFVIAVGVSRYQSSGVNLAFADKDAEALTELLSAQSRNFAVQAPCLLRNEEATRARLLKLKAELLMQTRENDQVVVFLAGHGMLDAEGHFYFGTHDVDFLRPAATGLSYDEIEDLLDGIPARKKLLLLDCCHSGELEGGPQEAAQAGAAGGRPGGPSSGKSAAASAQAGSVGEEPSAAPSNREPAQGVKRRNVMIARGVEVVSSAPPPTGGSFTLMQQLFFDLRRGSGTVVIAAADGPGFAYEKEGHGLFTYSILDAFQPQGSAGRAKADANGDGTVTVSELQKYIMRIVLEKSGGGQSPNARREDVEFDFGFSGSRAASPPRSAPEKRSGAKNNPRRR